MTALYKTPPSLAETTNVSKLIPMGYFYGDTTVFAGSADLDDLTCRLGGSLRIGDGGELLGEGPDAGSTPRRPGVSV